MAYQTDRPPPAAQPRASRRVRGVVTAAGVGAFAALCLAVATGLAFRHPDPPTMPAAAAGAPGNVAPGGTPTAEPTVPAGMPSRPKTLVSVDGRGTGRTKTFTTGTTWYLRYTYDCPSSAPPQGRVLIFEYSGSGAGKELTMENDQDGSDTLPQQGRPGSRYLRVISNCTWTLTVIG